MQAEQRINKGVGMRTADMACHLINILHWAKTRRKISIQKRVQAAFRITMKRQSDLLEILKRNVLEQLFQHDNHVVQVLHLVFTEDNVGHHEENLTIEAVHEEQNAIRSAIGPRILEEQEPIENALLLFGHLVLIVRQVELQLVQSRAIIQMKTVPQFPCKLLNPKHQISGDGEPLRLTEVLDFLTKAHNSCSKFRLRNIQHIFKQRLNRVNSKIIHNRNLQDH